ncbi:hypothetical protein C7821_109206 [Streptomyces sp. VMFN-G11Ma]|nr:hypothetical protein C7821_109206 [Streptomyces sp. VMFN-G11Ma]
MVLTKRLLWTLGCGLPVVLTLSACTRTPSDPPDVGYRQSSSGSVTVAYPLCPGQTVDGAAIVVRANRNSFDYKSLWKADRPADEEAARGLFTVGKSSSFTTQRQRLTGPLPQNFVITVRVLQDGRRTDSVDGVIDLKKLSSSALRAGEFMTYTGKVMNRGQIDAQLKCDREDEAP